MDYKSLLERLTSSGNLRTIPTEADPTSRMPLDLSTNDYMGYASDQSLQEQFFASTGRTSIPLTSSAARLLAGCQEHYHRLEKRLGELYGREALLFNSGYHANTGLVSGLTDSSDIILADKLVHASIIDGMKLSDATHNRWRHNDISHLKRLISRIREGQPEARIWIVAESVYSMDGDFAPIDELIELKEHDSNIMLYIDEAHAVGCMGHRGLGLVADHPKADRVDVIVGTLGKALASQGAYAIVSPMLRQVAVNRCRSFIFSTALPPISAAWSLFVLEHSIIQDELRNHLANISTRMRRNLGLEAGTHIVPYIIGDAKRTLDISHKLLDLGIKILPIRTPTVPPGTERLRISLNASMTADQIDMVSEAILKVTKQ